METTEDDNQLRDILLEYHGDHDSASVDLVDGIENICRTCLRKSPEEDLRSMFDEYTYIPVFLMSFAAVETPTANDRLPGFICVKCIDQVNQIYNFRKQIETADMKLRRIISECNTDDEDLIEEQLETEDYTNLDDIDMDDILSDALPIFSDNDKKVDVALVQEQIKEVLQVVREFNPCPVCHMNFDAPELLATHQETMHQTPPKLTCKHCKETFTHQFDHNLHLALHSKSFFCPHCKKDCGNKKGLKRHIAIHFKDKPYKCQDCQHQFAELASLNRHRKKQHLGVQQIKKFHCDSCQQQFYNKHTLEIHIRSKHTGVTPFSCMQCEKSFTDKRLLKSHMKVHTDIKDYVCGICNQAFKHRSTLVGHLRTHTTDRPFHCEICNARFKQKSHLSSHLLQHTGQKPFACKICDKKFTAASSLKVHERSHTGQKPFQCEICKKNFARKDMRAHYATHTGQKDFVCAEDGCDKAYATQSLLNMHRKMKHSDANPFVCTHEGCEKRFLSDINLKKHLKAHERKDKKITESLSLASNSQNLFPLESNKSLALCVMDELDQFMKEHQLPSMTTTKNSQS